MGIEVTDQGKFDAERDMLRAEVKRLTDLLEYYTTTALVSHPVATADSFAMTVGSDIVGACGDRRMNE